MSEIPVPWPNYEGLSNLENQAYSPSSTYPLMWFTSKVHISFYCEEN